jgi:hypothetical protein
MKQNFSTFATTAKGLSGSPLQIIALFLVLIYGFACLVICFGGKNLGSLGSHPFVYFLIGFPCLVLGVFVWLVRNHHWKLYGLSEFKDQKDFISLARAQATCPKTAQE